MSITHKPVLKRKDADIADYSLPRWDRDGNPVQPVNKAPKPTEVEDVPEQEVRMPTLEDIEAIREEAYNEGFEQGYEGGMKEGRRVGEAEGRKDGHSEGYQDGLAKGEKKGLQQTLKEEQKKTEQKLAVLDAAAEALNNQIGQEQDELQQALVSLAVRISRQVIQDELRLEDQHIADLVHAAVQSLPNPDDKLTLMIHPDDYPIVEKFAESHWNVVSDEKISAGGCQIKSGYSLIDYTLEHRFSNAVSHFISVLNRDDEEQLQAPLSEETLMPPPEPSTADADTTTPSDASEAAQTASDAASESDMAPTPPNSSPESTTDSGAAQEPAEETPTSARQMAEEQEEQFVEGLLSDPEPGSDADAAAETAAQSEQTESLNQEPAEHNQNTPGEVADEPDATD